jgi:hypothetical protein
MGPENLLYQFFFDIIETRIIIIMIINVEFSNIKKIKFKKTPASDRALKRSEQVRSFAAL